MATHIKFRLKNFSKSEEVIRFIKTPAGIISTTALGVSTANLATNASRHRSDRAYQDKQIKAMDKLTRSINGLDNTVKKGGIKEENPKPKFRPRILL
jgi:hypothetical protein